uniref:Thermosome, beta subunit n=1 Tax=uncultured organism TaxID=155900 RepID=M1P0U8_9ZZZZ|nr:thermosome, beta subunit [uncultured organism]
MMSGQQPVFVLQEDTERERGEDAQKNNISATKAIANAVRSTLGPKGMDKMLVDSLGDVVITNDGVSILNEIDIEHPAAKMLVEVAETQEEECGDGTTSGVVLAGELLKRSEDLLDKLHPSTIASGYRMAADKASQILEEMKEPIDVDDREMLESIASTAMTGKSIELDKEDLAEVSVDAVQHVVEETEEGYRVDMDNIKIENEPGATVDQTHMVDGIILDKEKLHENMPKEVEDAKIALLDTALEVQETEMDASIEITSPDQLQQFVDEEEESLKKMVQTVEDSGANVLLCQKGIDDLAQHYLAKKGIFAARRVKKSDMKKLAKATGGNVVNNLNDLSGEDLGESDRLHEKSISGSKMTFVEGTEEGKAVSILLRGGTEHVVDELERAIEDAIKVVAVAIEDGAILPGGGATEIELSSRLKEEVGKIDGRKQISFEAFADSLDIIPRTISENGGLDGIDVLMDLTTMHEKEDKTHYGVNIETEEKENMIDSGIVEPYRVKNQALKSATEAANMILRIDDVIASKGGDEGGGPPAGGGAPGGMPGGGMPGMM